MKGHYFIQAVTCIIHISYRKQCHFKKGSYLSFCYIVLLNIILRVVGFKNLSFWNSETIKLNIYSTITNIFNNYNFINCSTFFKNNIFKKTELPSIFNIRRRICNINMYSYTHMNTCTWPEECSPRPRNSTDCLLIRTTYFSPDSTNKELVSIKL